MAELYSTQQQKVEDNGVFDANELGGAVRVAYFEYTTTGSESAGDTLVLTTVPKGARMLAGEMHADEIDATGDDATTPTTFRIGDADDDDRFLAAQNFGGADFNGQINAPAEAGFGFVTTGETEMVMTFDAIDAEADKTIKGYFLYVPQA